MSRIGKRGPRDPEQYEITRKNYEYLMINKDTIKIKLLQKPFDTSTTWVCLSIFKMSPVMSFTVSNEGIESEVILLGTIKEYQQTTYIFQLELKKCNDDFYTICRGLSKDKHQSSKKEIDIDDSSSNSSDDDIECKDEDKKERVKTGTPVFEFDNGFFCLNSERNLPKEIDEEKEKSKSIKKHERIESDDENPQQKKKQDVDENSQISKLKTGPKQDKKLVEYNEKLFQYLMENKNNVKIKNLKHPRVGWICLSARKNSDDIFSFVAGIGNIRKEYTLKGYFISYAKKMTIGVKIEKNDDHYIITKGGKDCFPCEVETGTSKEPHASVTDDKHDKKRGRKESELGNIDFELTKKQDIGNGDINEDIDINDEDNKKSKKGSRSDLADNLLNVRKCCEYLINNPDTNIKVLQKLNREDFEGRYKILKLYAFLTITGGYDDVISFDSPNEDGTSSYHCLAGRLVKNPNNSMNFILRLKETSKDSNIYNVKSFKCKYEITKNPNGAFVIGEKLMKKYYSNIDNKEVVKEIGEFADQTLFGKLPTEQLPTEQLPTEQLPTEQLPTEQLPTEQLPTDESQNSKKREREEVVEIINPEPLKKQHQQFELGQCVEVEYTGADIMYKDVLYSAIYNQSLANDKHRCSIPVFTGREQPQYIWQSDNIHIPTQTNMLNKFVIGETVIIPMQRKLFNEYGEDIDGFSQVWVKGIIVSTPNLYVFNIEHTAWDKNDPNKKLIQSFNTNSIRKNYQSF